MVPRRTFAPMALLLAVVFSLAAHPLRAQDAAKPAAAAAAAPSPAAPSSAAPSPAPEYKIPPEAAKKPNPVKPTPSSLALGKKNYSVDCAVCHGPDGDGKGDLAADMKTPMPDFRSPDALKSFTDGELFYIIQTGKGEMPGEGDRAKPEAVWNLVNYVRSLAKKSAAEK